MTYLKKSLIDPDRCRKNPQFFSWIDRAFIRDGYLQRLCYEGIILYFFLIMVSDKRGLSFYSAKKMSEILKLDKQSLSKARRQLEIQNLIAYEYPIYQVLSLGEAKKECNPSESDIQKAPQSVKTVIASSFNKLLPKEKI